MAYDNLGRIVERTYPDGDRVSYSYDSLSRLAQVRGPNDGPVIVSSIAYSAEGEIENIVYGNGIETSYSYDSRHRLQEVLTSGTGETRGIELQHISFEFDAVSNITKVSDLRPDVGANDERHDSKVFEYDDLYRLRNYRLSDPAGIANRGQIDYRYDRIGNLLYRGSPAGVGHIEHTEAGKDVVNLGVYTYGGGRSNRIGRSTGDPPGPHAVTSTESGRNYDYDANGNMTEIDGFAATWDFEDRLVRLEKDDKTIEYVYDHTGRRVVKKITENSRTRYALYVEKGFEIREGEEPTKYVFALSRRLARVKGTLDPTAERIQRLRLTEGWNLACLAVELPTENAATVFGLGVDAAIEAVYAFENGKFIAIEDPEAPIERGRPYWVQCSAARILTRVGTYNPVPAEPRPLSEGLNPLGWSRLDALRVDDAFRGLASAWSFDGPSNDWLVRDFPAGPASNLTEPLASGAGIWAYAGAKASFDEGATSAQDILFYHPDHLGSTAVVTDLDGRVVSETAYYPFGVQRYELQSTSWFAGDYKFTGKERDRESGLSYYAARYYEPVLGKFISADPLFAATGDDGGNPQRLGLYSYVLNNPMRYTDPSGLFEEDTHGSMTYRMALAAGFGEKEAAIIALSTSGMDHDKRYSPLQKQNLGPGGTKDKHHFALVLKEGETGANTITGRGRGPGEYYNLERRYENLAVMEEEAIKGIEDNSGSMQALSAFGMVFHTIQDMGSMEAPGPHADISIYWFAGAAHKNIITEGCRPDRVHLNYYKSAATVEVQWAAMKRAARAHFGDDEAAKKLNESAYVGFKKDWLDNN